MENRNLTMLDTSNRSTIGGITDFRNIFIDRDKMVDLILFAQSRGEYSKKGSNSKCCVIGNYAVLATENIPIGDKNQEFEEVISIISNLNEQGVHVVPILGYATTEYSGGGYSKGFIIQERAIGKEMYDESMSPYRLTKEKALSLKNRVNQFANAPQEHFDKWVSDFKTITDAGIAIDPSKKSNFFYDEKKGFSFIDLNFKGQALFSEKDILGKESHRSFILYCLVPTLSFMFQNNSSTGEQLFTDEEFQQLKGDNGAIFLKIRNALLKIGITELDIKNAFEEQRTDMTRSGGVSIFGYKNFDELNTFCMTHLSQETQGNHEEIESEICTFS